MAKADTDSNSDLDLLSEYERLRDRLQNAPGNTLIVFVDLVGSTAFKERYGLLEGALRSDYHNRLVAKAAEQYGLRVVKSLGDGLLLAASRIDAPEAGKIFGQFAVECLASPERRLTGQPLLVSRIGAAYGPVVELSNGDVLGPTVDLAARLESSAKPGQAIAQASVFIGGRPAPHGFFVGEREATAVRGVAEPVAVCEVAKSSRQAQGIDCKERWSGYEFEVSLHPLASTRWPRISRGHVEAVVRLAYTGVLRRRKFDFLAMEGGTPFSTALRDPKIFSCFYFSPRLFRTEEQAARFFKVENLFVNGARAHEVEVTQRKPDGVFIRRRFSVEGTGLPAVGGRCNFSYTVRTVVPRRSSFFSMIVEQEVVSPTFTIHADALAVEWLRFAPFLPPDVAYEAVYTPSKKLPTSISIHVTGSVPSGSGVTFMWRETSLQE